MKSDSITDMHLTDEQLIAALSGLGPATSHIEACEKCESRRSFLLANREAVEAAESADRGVSFEFLAAQRRAIYDKLEARSAWPSMVAWKRWAPVVLTILVLGSGAAVYEKQYARPTGETQLSDAQLALEVIKMSQDWQMQPAAPLEGLFE
jgi:hypothetical protein